ADCAAAAPAFDALARALPAKAAVDRTAAAKAPARIRTVRAALVFGALDMRVMAYLPRFTRFRLSGSLFYDRGSHNQPCGFIGQPAGLAITHNQAAWLRVATRLAGRSPEGARGVIHAMGMIPRFHRAVSD